MLLDRVLESGAAVTMGLIILVVSILLQLVAAGLAFQLMRITGVITAWLLIAIALVLMSLRRSIVLYDIVVRDTVQPAHLPAELTALLISVLMLAGILLIRPFFVSHQRTEETLRESEGRFRGIVENLSDTYYRTDADGRITLATPSATDLLGYPLDELINKQLGNLYVNSRDRDVFLERLSEKGRVTAYESLLRHQDGSLVLAETSAHLLFDEYGEVTGVEGLARNITDRKQAEQVATRLGRIIEDSVNEIYVFDSESLNFIMVNRGARANLGYSEDEVSKLTPIDLKPKLTEVEFRQLIQPLRDGSVELVRFETLHLRKDGTYYPVVVRLQLSRSETPPVFFAIVQDISDSRRAEQELAQTRKMRAVGQLTGGIAHDFNNLLTVIMGNLQLAQGETEFSDELFGFLNESVGAAERGAALTQRLLAFSRKQPLRPQVVNLRTLIIGMGDLIQRSVKENIEVEVASDSRTWLCEADISQLENVLLNLVINARDAMPDGGTLSIATANTTLKDRLTGSHTNIPPGEYVLLKVSDTGAGMSRDVLENVFEPFFTTKEFGEGSGLGMSMVYGFAAQSNAYIDIESNLGDGTTISLYLPRSNAVGTEAELTATPSTGVDGGRETILVVEDQAAVRRTATALLRNLGYRTLEAGDGAAALELIGTRDDIDLLFTDMVMPGGMSGRELANNSRELRPDLKVLYTSGFNESTILDSNVLQSTELILNKPYLKEALAHTVREVLDQSS